MDWYKFYGKLGSRSFPEWGDSNYRHMIKTSKNMVIKIEIIQKLHMTAKSI